MKTLTIYYDGVVVNGYDNSGGLWFSESFTGTEDNLACALRRAYSVKEVVYVELTLGKWNVTFHDTEAHAIPKGEKV
jgi:hypothetical protein